MCLKAFQKLFQKPGLELKPEPVSNTMQMVVKRNFFLKHLKDRYGVLPLTERAMDNRLVLVSKERLDEIAPELVYSADWFADEYWDCDDYAMQAQCDAGRKFGVSVRLTIGQMELGPHAFVCALDVDMQLWLLEPNAGFPWAGKWFLPTLDYDKPLTDWLYTPEHVFI